MSLFAIILLCNGLSTKDISHLLPPMNYIQGTLLLLRARQLKLKPIPSTSFVDAIASEATNNTYRSGRGSSSGRRRAGAAAST